MCLDCFLKLDKNKFVFIVPLLLKSISSGNVFFFF